VSKPFVVLICLLLLAVSPAGSAAITAAPAGDPELVARGFERLMNMQPEPAIADLVLPFIQSARDPDSGSRTARYLALIGHGFALDGNVKAYQQCSKMALILAPNDANIIAFRIQSLLRASMSTEALPLVTEHAALATNSGYLARAFSDYYRFRNETAAANRYLKLAMNLAPDDPIPYAMFAKNGAKTPEEIGRYFKMAAAHALPGSYRQELLLWAAERGEKKDKADTEHLEAAARLLPEEPSWKLTKGFWLVGRGKQNEGFDLFVTAINSPSRLSLKALSQLATYCAYNKMPNSAMKAGNKVVELAPYLPESYLARGHVERQLGDTKAAIADYRKAIDANKHFSMAYEALAEFPDYKEGKEADWLAREWSTNCPDKADAWLFAADRARVVAKDLKQASIYYAHASQRLALSMKPPEKTVYTSCRIFAGDGTIAYQQGEFHKAAELARQFNERKPNTEGDIIRVRPSRIDFKKLTPGSKAELAAEHGAMADMLFEGGDLDNCIVEYKKAIALADNPEWHRGLLKAFMDKHDFRSAMSEDIVVSNNTVTKELPGALEKMRKQFGH
jgi:tetratricopeptide (TPR) repeat protein